MFGARTKSLLTMATSLVLALLLANVAAACPTCKDSLAHDPAGMYLARGYAYSILFMLSMPPLILGSLLAYFYWEIRKAKAQQQPAPRIEA